MTTFRDYNCLFWRQALPSKKTLIFHLKRKENNINMQQVLRCSDALFLRTKNLILYLVETELLFTYSGSSIEFMFSGIMSFGAELKFSERPGVIQRFLLS